MRRKRIVVTGCEGQVARSLLEIESPEFEIVALGRPVLDLAAPDTIAPALEAARPDVVVSAAAYTAVDKAESEPELAFAVNAMGASSLAAAAARLGLPIIHLSTDYIFDGSKPEPYVEDDPPAPLGIYGASKLEGERGVATANHEHVILRTSWVYSPFGRNFVRTMIDLGSRRDEIRVVGDQFGRPTYAPDIAQALLSVAGNLLSSDDRSLRGVFHLAGTGDTNWAEFAKAIFAGCSSRGARSPGVISITTADYPTAAARPPNSRLDCSRLENRHGIRLPDWHASLNTCLDVLLPA